MRRSHWLMVIPLVVLLAPSSASAHGDATTTVPAGGERVQRPPRSVRIDFSEPPTPDSKYSVIDGCGDEVLSRVVERSGERVLVVDGGQPGRWKVAYNVISSIDGHQTKDRFGFTVAGEKGCDGPPGNTGTEKSPDPGEQTPPAPPVEPSSFPVIPLAIGAVIVGGALAIRLFSSR